MTNFRCKEFPNGFKVVPLSNGFNFATQTFNKKEKKKILFLNAQNIRFWPLRN